MPIFDISSYNERKEWKDNEYLVNGQTGTKKCKHCGVTTYSVEFPSEYAFPDGKLPVCTRCLLGKKTRDEANILLSQFVVRKKCKKCEMEKDLSHYSLGGTGNTLKKICRECSSK